jgi:5-methyltetrahydropteroyltriglutamate--homocysteine methyltransferase
LRRGTWETLRGAGLTSVPSNTFSLYDHVLDTAVLFNAIPERFPGLTGLDAYFAMARGREDVPPLEMTNSECGEIVGAIGGLDANVTSVRR